ncbi:MAG: DUF1453 domain-containing protein [Opitutae bacterium]|nr:DUF1453 domain-containing protein [Opitutae bacterium]
MTTAQLAPAILIPLVAWRVYVRARRNIGRQPFRRGRLLARVVVYSVLATLIAVFAARHLPSLEAELSGLAGGALLAVAGLRLTRWEMTPEGNFYTPNAFLGIGLTLLFVGRIVYRFTALFAVPSAAGPGAPQLFQNPLTLAIFGVTVGYYIAYTAGVLARGRRVA